MTTHSRMVLLCFPQHLGFCVAGFVPLAVFAG